MKRKLQPKLLFFLLLGYILLQFLWWQWILVKQSNTINNEREKIAALNIADPTRLEKELANLHQLRVRQILMFTGEGTVFLLLLILGANYIRKAQERENAFNRQQENFFLSITHELKTPIAATKLQLQTLQRPSLEASQRSQLLEAALAENDRLNQLIDNVLLASRIENTTVTPMVEKVDLTQLTERIIERYFHATNQRARLRLQAQGSIIVLGDAHNLTSVVINLIDNALKYSPEPRPVEIKVTLDAQQACLVVTDEGKGISVEDKLKVFDRFYRTGDEATRSAKGTGLGLYIVKRIVSQHGGSIKVLDHSPNGSEFHVHLPLHH